MAASAKRTCVVTKGKLMIREPEIRRFAASKHVDPKVTLNNDIYDSRLCYEKNKNRDTDLSFVNIVKNAS